MVIDPQLKRSLGDAPPILADGRRAPDRREISLRWLAGTFLTGVTSSILMGVALFAALDGRQQLAIPAEAYAKTEAAVKTETTKQGGRLIPATIAPRATDKKILEVATLVKEGDQEVVRRQPFALVKMSLANAPTTQEDYPAFDPLAVMSSDDKEPEVPRAGVIYGSDVESEVSLKTEDFPLSRSEYAFAEPMSADEIEENVRTNGSVLTDGDSQVSALYYVDPQRFAADDEDVALATGITAQVIEQNMSTAEPESVTPQSPEFADDIIAIHRDTAISDAMVEAGYPGDQAKQVEQALSDLRSTPEVEEGDVLRIGLLQKGEKATIIRASVYRDGAHAATVAVDDRQHLVEASEPPMLDAVRTAFDDDAVVTTSDDNLPRVYDGIYRAALSYGMGQSMTSRVIKLLASSVDFQARLRPTDTLQAFFSVDRETGRADANSELLYLHAKFGDADARLYRFQDPEDGSVDYYNEDGKSLKQFLIRKPVPNGIFKSPFGMRRHPILGYMKMHTGVDWAAPSGTPIIAAGDGIVEKAGWDSGGYGNQTLIRHANGYVSSYNHQSAIAKGVKKGVRVHQGQIIGWVGTTGESTGPHLHYEMIVNGTKVDPLKIRLPGGKSLEGPSLARFQEERKRIDALLAKDGKQEQLASNSNG
ncbi:M23 family metallopeptidase [Gellertiella hungarica]|uniref:Murein DD-endopeptidase MepM/ murein hydrolase activator NlpD n=1 Tax=Gellertiella hungarica TaxID=1572859 RepID=A0A7W6J720_9HYPH|nr:M23 family metallopeptidase [Gellertiella hungarica]MBB4065088.1 murein DD-endopeptidase MepM/ murein hydrolase activator NlpD [Gellertiella hungarica]